MKKVVFIVAAVLLTLFSTAFIYGQSAEKETRDLSGFTKVSYGVPGTLYIKTGPDFRVVIEAERDLLEEIETEVSDGRLIIKNDNWTGFSNRKVVVNITMPSLEGLGVSGSGQAEVSDGLKCSDLELSVSGSGKIFMGDMNVSSLECSISGSGDIVISGDGDTGKARIRISGSGNYTGESLEIKDASVNISGSGSCNCNVSGTLRAEVSGSGSITYLGEPRVDARVSGSGRIRAR